MLESTLSEQANVLVARTRGQGTQPAIAMSSPLLYRLFHAASRLLHYTCEIFYKIKYLSDSRA